MVMVLGMSMGVFAEGTQTAGVQGTGQTALRYKKGRLGNIRPARACQTSVFCTKTVDDAIRRKRSDYQRATKSKNTVHMTMIAPYGVIQNAYANNLDSVVTGEDLFR